MNENMETDSIKNSGEISDIPNMINNDCSL